jgi:hypothetical protein
VIVKIDNSTDRALIWYYMKVRVVSLPNVEVAKDDSQMKWETHSAE